VTHGLLALDPLFSKGLDGGAQDVARDTEDVRGDEDGNEHHR
jgi:hypothetical protein